MRVLIVEDDPVSGLVLERTLQRWGYEVIKAKDGEEAWKKYQVAPVSLVITDWMMPHADGLELCRRIRNLARESYTYIILLTAKSQKSDLVEGMNAGADDFMTKPFDSAELQVRLRAGERVLNLESSFTKGQLEVQQVNAQLRQSIERQNLINQLLRALASSLDLDVVMSEAAEPLRQLFSSSRAFIRLLDQENQMLRMVGEDCAAGIACLGAINFPVETSDEIKDHFYNSSRVVSDLAQEAGGDLRITTKMLVNSFAVRALLCEPLTHQGSWFGDVGLHQCEQTRAWSEDEILLLNTLAQQMSVVVANAELHRRVQEQSVRDALTGLFNRRYFDTAFNNEFARASRYGQELSLVIVDLDYLKKINDALGHLAGDSAIRQTAEILAKQSRRVDIATRYGGEEFAVILPQTALEGARAAAEHWRQAINQCQIGDFRLSASIGIATFPSHASSKESLMQAADIALYRAKSAGRNRVCEAAAGEKEISSKG